MILENILGSLNLIPESLIPSLVPQMTKRSRVWASNVPPMLFPPPRLLVAFEEVGFILLFSLLRVIFSTLINFSSYYLQQDQQLFQQSPLSDRKRNPRVPFHHSFKDCHI